MPAQLDVRAAAAVRRSCCLPAQNRSCCVRCKTASADASAGPRQVGAPCASHAAPWRLCGNANCLAEVRRLDGWCPACGLAIPDRHRPRVSATPPPRPTPSRRDRAVVNSASIQSVAFVSRARQKAAACASRRASGRGPRGQRGHRTAPQPAGYKKLHVAAHQRQPALSRPDCSRFATCRCDRTPVSIAPVSQPSPPGFSP